MNLPKAIESEEIILGAILNHPEELASCVLEPKHFEDYKHHDIYEIMQRLLDAGKPVNYYSVGEALQNKKSFDGVTEKLDYLRGTFYFQKTFEKLEFEVLESYRKRTAIQQMQEEIARLFNPDERTEGIFSNMISKLTKISDPLLADDNSLDKLLEHIVDRALDPKKIYGLETGLADFDRQTHGLQKRQTFLLSGEPGTGKSILAMQLAFGMAEHGHPGVFYSLEMHPEDLYMRQLSARSGINTIRLLEGWDMIDELDRVSNMLSDLKKLPLTVRAPGGWTPARLRSDIARLKLQEGIEFVVIDYFNKIVDPSANNDIEKTSNISGALQNIALEFDVAILVIQSLVKSGYGGNPGMEHIGGSHDVSYDMDQGAVLVGSREEKIKELRWLKVRHSDERRNLKIMLKPGLPQFVSVIDENHNDYTV